MSVSSYFCLRKTINLETMILPLKVSFFDNFFETMILIYVLLTSRMFLCFTFFGNE